MNLLPPQLRSSWASPTYPSRSARRLALRCLSLLPILALSAFTLASAQAQITGTVTDQTGAVIPKAKVSDPETHQLLGVTDSSGRLTLNCESPCRVSIASSGFKTLTTEWTSAKPAVLRIADVSGPVTVEPAPTIMVSNSDGLGELPLQAAPAPTPVSPATSDPTKTQTHTETVTVTAYRTPLGVLESPASTHVLSSLTLQQAAPITLDGRLRLIAGAETFRRSSSLVANPSSQGLSLRGLGSTSASRTLVTDDDIPLNDAFAGWIHWEELPELSIHSIEVVRGGASDLYGSSAIGGVVNVIPQLPKTNHFELRSNYGSKNTYQDSVLAQGTHGPWGGLLTGGLLGTDGYIQTVNYQRGLIDTPSNVHAQNGLALIDRRQGQLRFFLRGSMLNEARDNGTPVQKNGTRIWRYATGADWDNPSSGQLTFRAYGSTEYYRQTFSSIASDRNSEVLNRFAKTPDNELGAVLHWSKSLSPHFLVLAGADTHDVRAGDFESIIRAGVLSRMNLNDRQRLTGAYAELLYTNAAWTVAASTRIDWFSNFDGYQWAPAQKALHHDSEHPVDPRLGVAYKFAQHFSLTGSGFRGFRAPTANELYRSTQVGAILTLPNGDLLSERATGWEAGAAMEQTWGTVRASYFWTQVNHPITALTITPTQSMRQNLGQIESRGISTELALQPTHWMNIDAGYQYTNASVTQYKQQPLLVGNWIPQVAHQMATAQVRAYRASIGTLSLQGKISGRQFDDDLNTYLLHSYFRLDAYASHDFGKRIQVYSSAENLLNRQIEVGRTPTLTIGTPRVARIGFNLKLGTQPN